MKPIGAYCLALDYKLINYSSQLLDAPFYAAEDKRVLKDQYSYMDPYSEAAQSRSDVWRAWAHHYGGVGGQGNPMLVYDALRQSYNTVAVWVATWWAWTSCTTLSTIRWECTYIDAGDRYGPGPAGPGFPESRYDGGAAGRCLQHLL